MQHCSYLGCPLVIQNLLKHVTFILSRLANIIIIMTLSILRLNGDRNGGAWCSASPVSRELGNNEWIQVDLGKMHVVTGVKTQGRFGNGRGAEYTEAYKLHYWRPGMTDFIEYHDSLGRKITTGKPSSLWQRQVKCARTLTHENCVFAVVFKSKQISR